MKIVLPGGAGYLGQFLARRFAAQGHEVVVLSRNTPLNNEQARRNGVRFVFWDGQTLGEWARELDGAGLVVNLAGRSVNCRYNAKNKRAIYDSRLDSTRILGQAIARCHNPPRVWMNASSATIYRHATDRAMDEESGENGSGFSFDVCRRWERVLEQAATPQTRKVALRTSMVFGSGDDGVFGAFARLVRLGLGGTLGRGDQFVSWIHIEDFARAIEWIYGCEELAGAVNMCSPHPLPNRELMKILRQEIERPIGLPATGWMLEIGAVFLQTETELLLKSRRVVPTRLLRSGFAFRFPDMRGAVRDILEMDEPEA